MFGSFLYGVVCPHLCLREKYAYLLSSLWASRLVNGNKRSGFATQTRPSILCRPDDRLLRHLWDSAFFRMAEDRTMAFLVAVVIAGP